MNILNNINVSVFVLSASLLFSTAVMSAPSKTGDGHAHTMNSAHHGGHHVRGNRHHGAGMMHKGWWHTLSNDQRSQLNRLRLRKIKGMLGLKAKKQVVKGELALLATKEAPSNSAINAKIEQLLKIKRQLLQLRYNHIVLVRKVLSPEQRVSFDLYILKKTQKRKNRHRRYH